MHPSSRPVLVLGARSDIGRAIAHRFVQEGFAVYLAARNADGLAVDAEDIRIRYKRDAEDVRTVEFDVTRPPQELLAAMGPSEARLAAVVCVVGDMGDQKLSEADPSAAMKVMIANYVGPASVMAALVEHMAPDGVMIGISSVAGDRGRATNYVYGSAKAGFTAFLSGMRNRLAKTGIHVMTVKPGFVNTRMTAGMKLPPRLTAEPAQVAEDVFLGFVKRRDVVYTKPIWRLVMAVIRAIPEGIFKKLKL